MESDEYRLETVFLPDHDSVLHIRRSARDPPTTAVWTNTRTIGRGGNGVVELQSGPSGLVRAVSDRHDLFVVFFGWYEDQHSLYIAMEFVANGDLGEYIKAHGKSRIPEATCQAISKQLLEAPQVLHERLICHRDLKPQNILVAALEPIHVKITDFGASKYLKGTESRTRVGTSGYMAPEILGVWSPPKGRVHFGRAVDLWAAGCIIYELLSLHRPFDRQLEDPDVTTEVYSGEDSDQIGAGAVWRQPEFDTTRESSVAGRSSSPSEGREALGYPWLLRPEQPFVDPVRLEPIGRPTFTDPPQPEPNLAECGVPLEDLITPTHYPHRAKALFPFEGLRHPSNETVLPFTMFEILEILDVTESPAWWSAKNESGDRGWVPSTCFLVIDSLPPAPVAVHGDERQYKIRIY
ncbi:uncharacterized protein H6S33_007039 [Morchella sextelata]|uniref:uncharacterized protein n=1 Tax=Morchella sextelata TaxID=1174677 RepID=UPI001D041D16|nr:uncharacterized protein H6S33_007039 [Morchella sextelata]KAH0604008.1 hypothetical protein H6S33_007039 [Morchella sextelata]